MHRTPRPVLRALCAVRGLGAAALTLVLVACGGDGDGSAAGPQSCSVANQQRWLGDYMNDWYFWTTLSPHPDAAAYADVASYFAALLYTGSDARFPRDRYSRSESSASFDRFFGAGRALGYGVAVAGLEVLSDPTQPLLVRAVEPKSPAGIQGVQRGDRLLSANGRSAAEMIAANDFSALSASQAGDTLTLVLRRGGVDTTVVLTAAEYALAPVTGTAVLQTAMGRKLGYLAVHEMIDQALAPMEAAFAQFKAAGVEDVVLDLRYNGGGLVSTGTTLASYLAGPRGSGLNYANLIFNDKHAATDNRSYGFQSLSSAVGLPRVFVLAGRRTCSASEQVINGLRGAGIEVVSIGETTCGKPVGFVPVSACGLTYSIVNFESVNQLNQGRYFDGFAPVCAVAEDFSVPLASATDPLLAAAKQVADGGGCPPATLNFRGTPAQRSDLRGDGPAQGRGMVAR